jgi:hypothetical protein
MTPTVRQFAGLGLFCLAIALWIGLGKVFETTDDNGQLWAIVLSMLVAVLPDLYYRTTRAPGSFVQKYVWPSAGFRVRYVPLWMLGVTFMGIAAWRAVMA